MQQPAQKAPQLRMVWPAEQLDRPPAVDVADGYRLRLIQAGDEPDYIRLFDEVTGELLDEQRASERMCNCLPDSFFVAVHESSGRLAASSFASHDPKPYLPNGGMVEWVVAGLQDRGKGLGRAVTAAVVGRLIAMGYRCIHLATDDFRLPALKIYITMGFVPLLHAPDMEARWKAVYSKLGIEPGRSWISP